MKGGISIYVLAAEYASFAIVCIAIYGLLMDKNVVLTRYQGLKWLYYTTFVTIVITIIGITMADNHQNSSLIAIEWFRVGYFLTSPAPALLYVMYSISIVYVKFKFKDLFIKFFAIAIPYFLYMVFVLTNFWHKLIFTICPEEGYVKGPLSQISYFIAFTYFAILIVYILLHIKTAQRNVLLVIFVNFLLSTIIFCIQIFLPLVQLSGLSCVCGLLVIHFYVLNVSKSVDPLTEVNNRQTLTAHLIQLCDSNTPFSLVVFSLRNFKSVNERFGLDSGDKILLELSLRLRNSLPAKNVYRFAGDEFAYLKPHPTNSFNDTLQSIIVNICKPYSVGELKLTMDMVYARVDFPKFGLTAKEIISSMDYSISKIKRNKGETNYFYDSTISDDMKRRNYIIGRLKHALSSDGFEVHYQAIYSTKSNKFNMAEALVRMKKTEGDFISPGEFIPIAEEIGLVSRITYIVLEKVCQDYNQLSELFKDKLCIQSISVNFPYVHFLKRDTVAEVVELMSRYNVAHNRVKFELTERTLFSDIKTTKSIMDELIAHGFEFELDDFGVDYSNLSLFFNVPIKVIKFDRSLVYAATFNPTRKRFFENLLKAIKAIDIQVVMEGIEEKELLDYLISCGCDYIQGYVFTKPLPIDEFCTFLKTYEETS